MSPRRQTSKRKPQKMSFAGSLLSSAGQMVAKHPSIIGGGTAFIIIFSFIASNALYYQKSNHPAPILNMRGPQMIVSGSTRKVETIRKVRVSDLNVKTFKVEHSDDIETASINPPVPADPAPRVQPVSNDEATIEQANRGDDVVRAIQTELARQDLYLDVIDGLTGPNTSKAIIAFQAKMGLEENGNASPELLSALKNTAQKRQEVAAVSQPSYDNNLVRLIQKGLSQSAYPHIEVDGLIGAQTRDAIAQFEKHYRLPVTGEPNQKVLDKLKSIGAL